MKRECHRLVSRPLYLFCMVIAPLFCYIFFTTLMDSGLPTNMPVGAVDLTILPAHETFSAIWTHSGKQLSWRVIAVLTKHVQLCRKAKSTDFFIYPKECRPMPRVNANPNYLLYQQLLPDCRLIIVQGYEDDVRTCLRSCRPFSFICQGSNGRSGDGIFTTHCH